MKHRHYILCAIVILVGLPVFAWGLLRAVDAHRAKQWVAIQDACDAAMVAHGLGPFTMKRYEGEVYREQWLRLCKPFHHADNPTPVRMDCEHAGYVVTQCEPPTRTGSIPACNLRIWSTCAVLFPTDNWQ